jgi:hypothetical protein
VNPASSGRWPTHVERPRSARALCRPETNCESVRSPKTVLR